MGTLLDVGNDVTISVEAGELKVRECGIKFVYNEDVEEYDHNVIEEKLDNPTA